MLKWLSSYIPLVVNIPVDCILYNAQRSIVSYVLQEIQNMFALCIKAASSVK